MAKHIEIFALAACLATFPPAVMSTAQANQLCSDSKPSDARGHWSWRLIDGRQCWYEGKPMLSKSLLEWPAQASAQPDASEAPTNVVSEKPGNPLDSQARLPDDLHSFEARWRARVGKHF
jgi:hypothetical protein